MSGRKYLADRGRTQQIRKAVAFHGRLLRESGLFDAADDSQLVRVKGEGPVHGQPVALGGDVVACLGASVSAPSCGH